MVTSVDILKQMKEKNLIFDCIVCKMTALYTTVIITLVNTNATEQQGTAMTTNLFNMLSSIYSEDIARSVAYLTDITLADVDLFKGMCVADDEIRETCSSFNKDLN